MYKNLIENKAFVLSKQILRSETYIRTNILRTIASESKTDFIHKLEIAAKESTETAYG